MIEPTDEMVQLALDVFLSTPTDNIAQIDAGMAKALAAVFAIVERVTDRDRCAECRCPTEWHRTNCCGDFGHCPCSVRMPS